MNTIRPFAFLALAATLAAGCAGAKARKAAAGRNASSAKTSGDASANPTPNVDSGEEASLRGKDFQPVAGLEAIYFDYDSASLKDAQLETLKTNADYLKAHAGIEALVAGYCDERGTIEYNLALGQKRAKEVRDYYLRLGVPPKSIATISYGKESPVCSDATEECWAKNRRAETRVRINVSDAGKPAEPAQ